MPLNEDHPIHALFYSVVDPQSPLDYFKDFEEITETPNPE